MSHLHCFGKLHNPLGPWLCDSHQQWRWFYDPISVAVYHFIAEQWHCHPPIIVPIQSQRLCSSRIWYSQLTITVSPDTPRVLLPTTIESSPGPHPIHFSSTPSQVPFPTIIKEYISIWPSTVPHYLVGTDLFYQYLLEPPMFFQFDEAIIADAARSGTLLTCSNGSFDPTTGLGSHGWVFAISRSLMLQGTGPMCGNRATSSAYRLELSGLVSLLFLLHRICEHHNVMSGKVSIFCNNKGAIRNVFHHQLLGISQFLHTDADLIMAAKDIIKLLPIKIDTRWLKGHSMSKNKTPQEEMNIQVDMLAADYASSPHPKHMPKSMPLLRPGFKVRIVHNRSTVTTKLYRALLKAKHSSVLQRHVQKKGNWPDNIFAQIN